ncbi:MAG TPA: hypothetical protein VHB27_23600, partial [Rhodopila sp.]|nr:hypothetical protein [Rhodopila sp.]
MRITELPAALLRTVLRHLAVLLLEGANGNHQEAWEAAEALILGHCPRTEAELHLIYRILAFNLQAGEALAQAVQPDMPLNRVLRLRSGAVALAREVAKAERRLEQLRAAAEPGQLTQRQPEHRQPEHRQPAQRQPEQPQPEQRQPQPQSQPEPMPEPAPSVEKVGALIEENRTVSAYAKAFGISFTEALRRRARDKRVAERERKKVAQAIAASGT